MSKINEFKTSFQNSQSKIKNSWDKFKKFSLATKSVIITGIILSLIGLTASVLIIGSFAFIAIEDQKAISKIVDFKTCQETYRVTKKEIAFSPDESKDFEFASCKGNNQEFYVKYKKFDTYEYKKHQILSKTDFENQVKLAQNGQSTPNNPTPQIPDYSENSNQISGLIGGNPNPNTILQKFSQDFFPISAENEKGQKTKIDQIDTKNSKIDFAKNPKPWRLVRAELSPSPSSGSYGVNKLVDVNLNEILPSFNDFNLENYNSMKPIFVESAKTLYFPYRYGKIAVLNTETGDLKWDTFDFEIAQMSLFGGKYYLNEYKETCDADKYSQILTCNLLEIDRSNLKDRKVALNNIKNNQIVIFANEKNVWLKTIYKQKYSSYGQSSSESGFTQNSFSNIEIEKFEKYKSKKDSISFPSFHLTFEQTKDLIGVSFDDRSNYPKLQEEKVANCPKSDRQNPCWSEMEKLVNKYRQGLEFKDEELEKFWSELKENKPQNLEIKCGDFEIGGENGKIWKYKNNSISGFKPFENLRIGSLQCFG